MDHQYPQDARTPLQQSWLPGLHGAQTCRVRVEKQTLGASTRGLMVRDPYATQLLNGEKTWEVRGRATQIRGTVVIIKSGTGRAYGVVELLRVVGPLSLDDLVTSDHLTTAEREEFPRFGLPYPKTFVYEVRNARWFEEPIPYEHPNGAVTWVNLPALDPVKARYALFSRCTAESSLV